MAREQILISVAGDKAQLKALIPELEKLGVEVGQVLELSGIITGTVDPERVAELDKLQGISAVEMSRAYRIAPPESEIQSLDKKSGDQPHSSESF